MIGAETLSTLSLDSTPSLGEEEEEDEDDDYDVHHLLCVGRCSSPHTTQSWWKTPAHLLMDKM